MDIKDTEIKERVNNVWFAMCVLDDFNNAMKDTYREYNILDSDGAILSRNYHFVKMYLDRIQRNLSIIYEILDNIEKGEE